jgi:hypothetical protein
MKVWLIVGLVGLGTAALAGPAPGGGADAGPAPRWFADYAAARAAARQSGKPLFVVFR